MAKYLVRDEFGSKTEFKASSDASAKAKAYDWMRGADFDLASREVHYTATLLRLDIAKTWAHVCCLSVTFDQPEPERSAAR